MSIKDWASINGHQHSNMIFIKDIMMIYLRYHLSAAQAGSLCYQIPSDRLTESQGKETFARGSIGYSIVGGHLRVPPLFRADTQVRPYKLITVCLQHGMKTPGISKPWAPKNDVSF
jgi:hypothetical protein